MSSITDKFLEDLIIQEYGLVLAEYLYFWILAASTYFQVSKN